MQFFTLASLISAVAAISVSQPAQNAVWTSGVSQTVSWSSVNTDAQEVSVYLVNFSKYPTISQLIQANVTTSTGTITVPGADITSTGAGFQINLLAVDNPSQILAQSNQFSIVAGSSSASSSAAAAATTTTTSAAATTVATSTTSKAASTSSVAVSGNNSTVSGTNGTLPSSNRTTSSAIAVAKLSLASLFMAGALCLF